MSSSSRRDRLVALKYEWMPLAHSGSSRRLDHLVRHRAEQVRDRLRDLAERAHEALAFPDRPGGDRDEHGDLLAVPLLRDHGQRRRRRQVDEPGDLVGRVGRPVAEHAQQVAARLARVEDRPGVDHRPERMELELEPRDDAEVAAAAAQAPEQVGVLRLARVDEPAVGGDDVGADEVVAREPELPHRPADAAAEREARRRPSSRRGRRSSRARAPASRGRRRPTPRRRRPSPGERPDRHGRRSSATGRSRCRRRTSRSRRRCGRRRARRS